MKKDMETMFLALGTVNTIFVTNYTVMAVTAITGLYYAGSLTATSISASSISSTPAITESAQTGVVSDETGSTTVASGNYTDGVYTSSGTGFLGTTTVSVTVSGGNITAINIVSYADDREYFVRAENSIISSIISN